MKGVHKLNQGLRIMGELPGGLEGWVHGRTLHHVSWLLCVAIHGQGQVWSQRQMWRFSVSSGMLKDLAQLMVTGCPALTITPCQSVEAVGQLGIVPGCLVTSVTAALGKEESLPVRGMKSWPGKPVSIHIHRAFTEKHQTDSSSWFPAALPTGG